MEQAIIFTLISMGTAFAIVGVSFVVIIVSELREMNKDDE